MKEALQSPGRGHPHPGSLIMESDRKTLGIITKWDKIRKRVHIEWCKPVWGQMTSVEPEFNVTWSPHHECLIIDVIPF